jgi:GT2 family glycosyltransferase
MILSIVIPTFNGADYIAEQLGALANQVLPGPFEVIISDNGSTDATRTIADGFVGRVPGLRIIDSSRRPGRSYARNTGAEAASSEALAFTDQDDVVGDNWVRAMGTALEYHDFVTGSTETKRLNARWRIHRFNWPEHELWFHNHLPHLAGACGNNIGVTRSIHRRIGGFDESLMLGWEDHDYAIRVQLAGTPVHFAPDAIVHYRLRHDLVGIFRQAQGYGEGNVAFYKKYESMARASESWNTRMRAWTRLLNPRTVYSLRKKSNLALWLSHLGWSIGHLRGCAKHHVWAPSYWAFDPPDTAAPAYRAARW